MQVHYSLDTLPDFSNTVLTIGSFDGVHLGHQLLLKQVTDKARALNTKSVVITFDPHPRLALSGQPSDFATLCSTDEKIYLLQDLGIDHLVVVPFTQAFASQSATSYLHDFIMVYFKPRCIIIGYDHRYGAKRVGDLTLMQQTLEPLGVEVIEIDPLLIENNAISSSGIRRALAEGDMQTVKKLSGHPFIIKSQVIKGDQIGRTIGFPTANIKISYPHKALPKNGIYAGTLTIDNRTFEGMAYIGKRPVLGKDLATVIEINLFDFEEDIYDKEVVLKLHHFIRDDMPLSSLDGLKSLLKNDEKSIRSYFINEKEAKKTAVVVLNYNTVDLLKKYIPTLIQYTPSADIVVVDNGSTDGSVNYLKSLTHQIQIITLNKNYGFTGGYNLAIDQIKNDFIVLLNSDVRVTEGWLEPMIECLESNRNIAIVQPKILNENNPEHFDYAGAAGGWLDILGYPFCRGRIFDVNEKDTGQYNDQAEIFWASGAAMLIRRSVYMSMSGLDSDFFAHMEEIDLAWRIKRCGYKIVVEPKSEVYHLGGGTLSMQSPNKIKLNFRNSLITLLKNEKSTRLIPFIFIRLCLDGIAGIKFLFEGKISYTWSIIKAHFAFYKTIPSNLRKRNEINKIVKINSVGPENTAGRWNHAIVIAYYLRKRKFFSALPFIDKKI